MLDPAAIQAHLYKAFIDGNTPDVSLTVRGSWDGLYRLHRVVLIQAGFFSSLFDSGFREARQGDQNAVTVTFDDPNISRAAFDFCLSRLYGGGPALHVDSRLIPTRREPLTPGFPNPAPSLPVPANAHPASPRFLLSLLATAIYLSIPSLVSQAIQLVLQSLGPHTVVRYLNFAIGKGIGEEEKDETTLIKGLEGICLQARPPTCRSTSVRSKNSHLSKASRASRASRRTAHNIFSPSSPSVPEKDCKDADSTINGTGVATDYDDTDDDDNDSETASERGLGPDDDEEIDGPIFMYGNASNKIGEAAACWLCRWGADMLAYEEAVEESAELTTAKPGASTSRGGTTSGSLRVPDGSSSSTSGPSVSDGTKANWNVPTIWRRGGISARWARVVLSSDTFFVKSEKERYLIAKRAVELRRRAVLKLGKTSDPEEEVQWTELFTNGIHYMHMALDDLMSIASDVSPITGRPYAPPSILQTAHWNQSLLRHHINNRSHGSTFTSSPPSPPRSPPPTSTSTASSASEKGGLGLSLTTTEILNRLPDHEAGSLDAHKVYYPVPVDASSRVGDTAGLEGASMDQLFSSPASLATPSSPKRQHASGNNNKSAPFVSHPPSTFFGILSQPKNASGAIESDPTGRASWSAFPPIRFGVEFWGVERLAEKERLTSQTIWYAGSLFNIYVQVVRKKGLQLGMYVHRLSSVETIPAPSAPPVSMLEFTRESGGNGRDRDRERYGLGIGGVAFERSETIDITPSASTPSLYRPASRNTVAVPYSPPGSNSYSPPPTARSVGGGTTASTHSPSNSAGSISNPGTGFTSSPRPPPQPYRDPREVVGAHFTLHVASPTGGALTRFASGPDAFYVGRSWGWKSSALQTEELVEVDTSLGRGSAGTGSTKNVCSLRAMVVLGVV